MTAREGAVIRPEKRAMNAMVGVATAGRYVTPGSAMRLLDYLADAGLRIVDAELHQALVEAVRAAMWCDARSWAARYPWRQQVHSNFHESELANERNVATLAHRRAVELLDERGE